MVIRLGSKGDVVEKWQHFLIGQGYQLNASGNFDDLTHKASVEYQAKNKLTADGIVGNKTYAVAMLSGFALVDDDSTDENSQNWPPPPSFQAISNNEARQKIWGAFKYEPDPTQAGRIKILDNWENENIVEIEIPQLKNIKYGAPVKFHKKAVPQLLKLWKAWEDAGLLNLVLTWNGAYTPRFVMGSSTGTLSNHAFGTAFDINVKWNGLGVMPPLVGKEGSVRKLVPIANELGFYWGGHYTKRPDGMHFEVIKLM